MVESEVYLGVEFPGDCDLFSNTTKLCAPAILAVFKMPSGASVSVVIASATSCHIRHNNIEMYVCPSCWCGAAGARQASTACRCGRSKTAAFFCVPGFHVSLMVRSQTLSVLHDLHIP